MVVLGIDLGTTFSCVVVIDKNRPVVIQSENGNRTMPSYVGFENEEILVGEYGKQLLEDCPEKAVYNCKRLIGRSFHDPEVQQDIKLYSFKIINKENKPVIEIEDGNTTKHFTPEEISGIILKKMHEEAEKFLLKAVTDAVITVPASFSSKQREATIDAGKMAGLNVIKIITEPTAAALAYGFDNIESDKKTVLVYDLGGGTFDVTIIKITNGKQFEVLATAGDSHLGGEDFDNKLLEHVSAEFKAKHSDEVKSKLAQARLKLKCEIAKKELSSRLKAKLFLSQLVGTKDLRVTVERKTFETLCENLFLKTIDTLKNALIDAKLKKSDIDDVVLTGGSTRIPKIQELLQKFFDGKTLQMNISPEEAVAHGAALYGAKLSGNDSSVINEILLTEVVPRSLGIQSSHGRMFTIINRNNPTPVKNEQEFLMPENTKSMDIRIYEGERAFVKDNTFLGQIRLEGLKPLPHLENSYVATFEVNDNGILSVSAKEKNSGKTGQLSCVALSQLNDEEKEKLMKEGEKYKEEHAIAEDLQTMISELEDYAYEKKRLVTDPRSVVGKDIVKCCESTLKWIKSFKGVLPSKSEIRKAHDDLRKVCEQ